MKVNPLTQAAQFFNRVTERREQDAYDGSQKRGKQRDQESPKKKKSSEEFQAEVEAAVKSFEKDKSTTAVGLHAHSEGKGPGLKVILKDVSGNVVRQFTGEEFLKLREVASDQPRGRGKILDQKY